MSRVFNFCAGPATMPTEVLKEVQAELLDWNGLGVSVMEVSHRAEPFVTLTEQIEQDFRELYSVPKNYHVIFVQGGGRGQFAMVPMNLLRGKKSADYINTGVWSQIAINEASKFCEVNQSASAENSGYTSIPERSSWNLNPDAAYVHIVENETVNGVEFFEPPDVGDVPLVSDMSSCILSHPVDFSRYDVIYAGAQKNIGPAGITIVCIREDLVGHAPRSVPSYFNWESHVKAHSMYNTPPTFAWYVSGKIFRWILDQGGLVSIMQRNHRKATKLYSAIDATDFYINNVDPSCRSRMNVVFHLADESLIPRFIEEAEKQGLVGLKGHQLVGGLRASIYNAMPEAGVDKLIEFMREFEHKEG